MIARHALPDAAAERLRFTPTPTQTEEMMDQLAKDLEVLCSLQVKRASSVAA